MSSYTYHISTDFSNASQVDVLGLTTLITHDTGISQTLNSIDTPDSDTVIFNFAAALSTDEEASLTNDVHNYQYAIYCYSIATDFKNATQIDPQDINNMVLNDTNITETLVTILQPNPDAVQFLFATALSSDEKASLDADVAAYVFVLYTNDNVVGVSEVQAPGVNGGTFTSGSWFTRTLNNKSAIVRWLKLASNQITLQPGIYLINAIVPARGVGAHQARLQNITSSTTLVSGTADYSAADTTKSLFSKRIVLTSPTTFEVQHQCQTTVTDTGLGSAAGFTGTLNELYTMVNIQVFN